MTNFRRFLRINTVHPDPNYGPCVDFLKEMAAELKCDVKVIETIPKNPFVIITRHGTDPSLKSIVAYCHMDVVPVFPEHWKYDPFSAHKDENGDIYARGSQDMKCVGSQYLEALRRLMHAGNDKFLRTIHFIFAPDEEVGGIKGMRAFVDTESYADLNCGFHMDEGIASPTDVYNVYNAERSPMKAIVTCPGKPGHGSIFIQDTAAEKFRRVINAFLEKRSTEEQRFYDQHLTMGEVTSINLTKIEGGVQLNVVPDKMVACFDVRLPPTIDSDAFFDEVNDWCATAGEGVTVEWIEQTLSKAMTSVDAKDPWWQCYIDVFRANNMKYKVETFVGATDARYVRLKGKPAIGFSPMINTPVLLHDHNEFLNETIFLQGVTVYEQLLAKLANVPQFD